MSGNGRRISDEAALEQWPYEIPEAIPLNTEIVGTDKTFGDFLAWANSEILDSQRRGFVAEFMVMEALGLDYPYISGDMYDLRYRGGVQVKASSAVQLWGGPRVHRIGFSTKPKRAYREDADGKLVALPAQRRGRCWVFAVHVPGSHDPAIARREVLDVGRWRYWVTDPRAIRFDYVAPRGPSMAMIPGHVTLLSVIANLGEGVRREGLRSAVDQVMDAYQDVEPPGWTRTVRMEQWELEERLHLVQAPAMVAVRKAIEALRATYPERLVLGFSPGVVRAKRQGDQRVAISLEFVNDLAAGKARVLRWRGNELLRTWDDGLTYDFADLPDAVVGALM